MHKILIIEGQEDLLNELGVSFEIEGLPSCQSTPGDTTVTMAMSQNPDLNTAECRATGNGSLTYAETCAKEDLKDDHYAGCQEERSIGL